MKKCRNAMEADLTCQRCCFGCIELSTCADACREITENCEELIEVSEELELIRNTVPDVLKAITELAIEKKRIEAQEKVMKTKLLEAMEEHSVKSFENEDVKFTYVAPTTRTTIDSKRLKEECPDVAEKYSKASNVSASVKITVK